MDETRPSEFLADYELDFTDVDLKELDLTLSQEEDMLLQEIVTLQGDVDNKGNLMHDMLEAAKQGAMNYLDSMTDTGETFDRMKDPQSVKASDATDIERKTRSANPEENKAMGARAKGAARYTPFDGDSAATTSGMSEAGAKKFQSYVNAYAQRTKSITAISKDGNTIPYKQDPSANLESLSGLRGYRVGPVVPMTPIDEVTKLYNQDLKEGNVVKASGWVRKMNYDTFDSHLVEKYGFKNKTQAAKWRKDNHLTIHESPDGMFLVPTDIHDAASHSGYCSMVVKYLNGGTTAEGKKAIDKFITDERIAYTKHEVKTRGTRAVKGVGMAMIKEILSCGIGAIIKESIEEFKHCSEDSFVKRMMRVLQKSWDYVKKKCKAILDKLWKTLKGSLLSEFLTMLNDFFLKTFKNTVRLIRQLWSSIKSAFKIIFSKEGKYSWGERIFEATKILSAGIVGVIGFSLNELIDKGLTAIGVPFASFISECLSGLFAGVMSAMVLMMFDNVKKNYKANSAETQQMLLKSKYLMTGVARIQISSIIVDNRISETYNFFGTTFSIIQQHRANIEVLQIEGESLSQDCNNELEAQKKRTQKLIELTEKHNNDEF